MRGWKMPHIVTRVTLPFSAEDVWSVLVDFPAYREWNPLNVAAEGLPTPGARVPMTFIDPGRPGRTLTQRVRIIAAERPRRLAWVGVVPLLFRGEHYFALSGRKNLTDLTHGERLTGLIPRLWTPDRLEQQRNAYEAMNHALSERLKSLFGRN
jgi:hypothetical protein